jgi:hypothetical protein
MVQRRSLRALALLGAAALAAGMASPVVANAGAGSSSGPEVIASGLNNPRGLAFAPNGALFVAEAGLGGDGPCFVSPEGESCFGHSGSVTRIGKAGQRRFLPRLPSYAGVDGTAGIGPSDVAFGKNRRMYVTVGLGLDLDVSKTLPELHEMGELVSTKVHRKYWHPTSQPRTVADLAAFEDRFNPTGDEENVNPNSVLSTRHGRVVADAGANDLLKVTKHGRVKVLATFPNRMVDAPDFLGLPPGTKLEMDAVPTSVAKGPDGAYYVGQLTGFPFPVGGAKVYRIEPGKKPKVYASGFTNIIDIGFDHRGRLHVLEIFTNGFLSEDPTGALIRVGRDGRQHVVMSEGLVTPGGLAIRGGSAYVSNCSICGSGGEVLRIPLG